MLKKWFLLLLALAMLFTLAACNKEDPTPPPNDDTGNPTTSTSPSTAVVAHSGTLQNGAISWEIHTVNGTDGKHYLKGSGALEDFESAQDQPWWMYGDTKTYGERNTMEDAIVLVTAIVVEEGITALGANAFADQDSVTTVTLPSTLTTLGEACFKDCQKLSTVNGGVGIASIDDEAFHSCTSLESIELSSALTHVGVSAFDFLGEITLTVRFQGTEEQWNAIVCEYGNTKFKDVEPSYALR